MCNCIHCRSKNEMFRRRVIERNGLPIIDAKFKRAHDIRQAIAYLSDQEPSPVIEHQIAKLTMELYHVTH